jgi:tetratricopeptide (TPR) repeat protein
MAGNQQNFRSAMSRGNSAAWELDWQAAVNHYQTALEEFPENSMALTSLGLAFYELRDYESALDFYKKAALVAPDDPTPPEKIADIFERQGRIEEAIQAVVHAAELHLKLRDAEKAISCYERATSLEPQNLHAHTRLALIFERMRKNDRAIEEFLAAASILQLTGQLNRARKTVEHCLLIDSVSIPAKEALRTLNEMGMLPEPKPRTNVEATLRMAEVMEPKMDPITKELITMVDTLPTEFFKQQSLVVLASMLFDSITSLSFTTDAKKAAAQRDSDELMVALNKAVNHLTHNDPQKAVPFMEELMKAGVDSPAVTYNLGYALMHENPRRAVEVLEQCVRKDDYAMGAFLILGKIFSRRGGTNNLRRGVTFYLRALCMADLYTVDSSRHLALREAYVPVMDTPSQISNDAELEKLCKTIDSQINRKDWMAYLNSIRAQLPESEEKSPPPLSDLILTTNNTQMLEAIAHIRQLIDQKKYDYALEEAYYALQFAPSYLPLHIEIAHLQTFQEDFQQAVEKFSLVSRLYLLRGEVRQGARMIEEALKLNPMDIGLRTKLIDLLTEQDRITDALEHYMALAQNYEVYANFDQMRKVYFDALRLSSKIPNSDDRNIEILNKIADIDMQRLDWHRAQRVYEQIKSLAPNDGEVRNNLIGVYYRLGQTDAAEHEIEDFISVMRNSRQYEKGVDFLLKLINEWPQKYNQREMLAELYLRMGRRENTLDEYNTVASAYLDEGDMSNTIRILQRMMTIDPEHGGEYQLVVNRLRKQAQGS